MDRLMDYSEYTTAPRFSREQSGKIRRYKKFLSNGHGASSTQRVRSKLHDLYMSRRGQMADYATPVYGRGSMSRMEMDSQVVPQVRMKFGNEIDASASRRAQIGKYYDDWQVELSNLKQQQNAQMQASIDAMNNAQQTTAKNEQSANESLLAQMQKDAASRGATIDPSLFVKANQASASRGATKNMQAAQLAANKSAYDTYYSSQGLINRGRKKGALDKEQAYTTRLRSDAADYAAGLRKELDATSYERGWRQRQADAEAAAARAEAEAKAAELALKQQYQNRQLANERSKIRTGRINANANLYRAKNPKQSEAAAFTPAALRTSNKDWDNLAAWVDANVKDYRKWRATDLSNALQKGQKLPDGTKIAGATKDGWLAMAYATYKRYGGVTAKQRQKLKNNYGLDMPYSDAAQKAGKGKR